MKFTKEELNQFIWNNSKFNCICKNICKELSRWNDVFKFMNQFSIEDKKVCCDGDEYWRYGGHEHYTDYFDIELLTYSKEELDNYVNALILKESEQKAKECAKKLKDEKERELKELKRLKEKYEKQIIYISR